MEHQPIEPRIMSIISDGRWYTRKQIAEALGRPFSTLASSDLQCLDRMLQMSKIEHRVMFSVARGVHEYRKAQS